MVLYKLWFYSNILIDYICYIVYTYILFAIVIMVSHIAWARECSMRYSDLTFNSPILIYSPISSTRESRVLSNFFPVHTEVLYVTVFSKWLVWRVRWWHQLQWRGGTHMNLYCMLTEAVSVCGKNWTLAGWPRELVYITGPCWYRRSVLCHPFPFIFPLTGLLGSQCP